MVQPYPLIEHLRVGGNWFWNIPEKQVRNKGMMVI